MDGVNHLVNNSPVLRMVKVTGDLGWMCQEGPQWQPEPTASHPSRAGLCSGEREPERLAGTSAGRPRRETGPWWVRGPCTAHSASCCWHPSAFCIQGPQVSDPQSALHRSSPLLTSHYFFPFLPQDPLLVLGSLSVKSIDFIHQPDISQCALSDLSCQVGAAGQEHQECSTLLNFEKPQELVLRATVGV